jgi:type I restriction enzyme, S subunit
MSPDSLLRQLDVVADTPGGVQKVRELILQLAVRGKLVPQDPSDEPAGVLLERLEENKAGHTGVRRSGSARAEALSALSTIERPSTWKSIRLGEVLTVQNGFAFNSESFNDAGRGVPLIRIRDLSSDCTTVFYDGQYREEFIVNGGDYLIGMDGNFELHEWTGGTALLNQRVCRLKDIEDVVDRRFVYWMVRVALDEIHAGTSFVTVKHLSSRSIESIQLPLPPLAEQRRIVAKVDELMALCDRLEAHQQRRAEARVRVNRSALHHLTEAVDDEEVAVHWNRLRQHFDLLYDAPETVAELRQAVLQLAVRGKLVPQDPRDEPASVLLERIAAEQQRMLEAGKVGKLRSLPRVDPSEVPFEVPEGWGWARFAQVAHIASNLVSPHGFGDLPHVAPDCIEKGTGRLLQFRTVAEDGVRSGKHRFYAGQVLYSKIRPNLSKAVLIDFDGLCSADMYPVDSHIEAPYLLTFILSRVFLSMAIRNDTRVAMPKINQDDLYRIVVPVPPLSEQRRIVTKVDQLMTLCGHLESRLVVEREKSTHLAASLVHHLTAA